ncbi:MAG: hypothetical protein IPM02_26045 [Betaproteobacteria bacterium]|nr:hypothetical protein [Betaproteobacteria bacterium]
MLISSVRWQKLTLVFYSKCMRAPMGSAIPISSVAREPLTVLVLGALCFIAWALHAGPDMNWDFLNYHLYAGLHASGDALSRDFFPADSQSYFTPYGYWPMAAMIAAKWPAMMVGGTMAAIHSLAVLGTWYLSKQLFPDGSSKSLALRTIATVLESSTQWFDSSRNVLY